MVVVTGGSQGHLSGQPVWSIQWVSLCGQSMGCSGNWMKRRGVFLERLWGFGCWERLSQLFSPSFLVSYSKARKEACGLRQCQTPFWSPANCKEEGWNQNRKGKASRRMCSHPFISWGLHLPTEQFLSAPLPLHWVCFVQSGVVNWWSLARYFLLICLVLESRVVSVVLVQTRHHQWASLGGQGLGVHLLRHCRTSNLCQESPYTSGRSKALQCLSKICRFVCFLGLSPHLIAVVTVSVWVLLEVGCVCEVLWYSKTETLRSVNYKFIGGNAPYAHLMTLFCCLLVTITGQ